MSLEFLDHLRRRFAGRPEARPMVAFGQGAAERLLAAAEAAPASELIAVLPIEGDIQDVEASFGERPCRVRRGDLETVGSIFDLLASEGLAADQAVWILADEPAGTARTFLLAAAARGLLPRKDGLSIWRMDNPAETALACEFEARAYAVRPADADDLVALRRLEEDCWRPEIRAGEAELLQRIANHPEGQLALEVEGEVVGVIYSQRIDDPDRLDGLTSAQAPSLHRAEGAWVQLIALNVAGVAQSGGLGDQLLDFMLDLCLADRGCRGVCAVTLCRDYDAAEVPEIGRYVAQRDSNGAPVDAILRFHHLHGAEIRKPMPGYRPTDGRNRGHGVLIAYDLEDLAARRRAAADDRASARTATDAASVQAILVRALAAAKPDASALDPERAFVDQGWDSLDLMQLRALLGGALGVALDPTLFFRFPTPAAVAAHLCGAAEDEGADAPPLASANDDPVAIVGMACRFPGGASDPAAFWNLLIGEVDAITPAPASRDLAPPGQEDRAPALGGYIDDVDLFDAEFFGVAPREARHMDPQQRWLLDLAWGALEDAGVDPESLGGSATGVFVGAFTHDYETLQIRQGVDAVSAYLGSGSSAAMLAGRLSYVLGLRGPALTVNTACSSSLVALHLARRSLQSGECGLALVGGANLILSPELGLAFDKAGMLSPDGRCKSFDASADGYVRSEGCAVIVLKPLSRATADGDRIWAVVRGSATNQDGASNGLTAPSEDAQAAVIRSALASANLTPAEVGYVEAHGTGTPLGDPIEARALGRAYGPGRTADAPLIIGSVKSNIGHLEAAAGLAGVIKVVLALHHEQVPPNLHFRKLNPQVRLAEIPALLAERALPWPAVDGVPRRAGVSSFGFSGSNAHVILESPPARPEPVNPCDRDHHVLALSARSDAALLQLARRYLVRLTDAETPIADLCAAANAGRRHFGHRLAAVGDSSESLREALSAFLEDRDNPNLFVGVARDAVATAPMVVAAAPSARAASDLYATSPTFRRGFDTWSSQAGEPQPAGEAARAGQAGLVALWRSWGVAPDLKEVPGLSPTDERLVSIGEGGASAWRDLMRELGRLYVAGATIDWRGLDADYQRRPVEVPGYPFERRSFWLDRASPAVPPPSRSSRAQAQQTAMAAGSIRDLIAGLLERDPAAITPATPLIQFGLDSLMALELQRALSAQFGLEIGVRDLLTEATVASLEVAVSAGPGGEARPPAPPKDPPAGTRSWDLDPAALLERLNDLGEQELDELLRAAEAAV